MKEYKVDLSMYDGMVREVVSEAIQRHAFKLGYEWYEGGKKEILTNSPYLFFDEGCSITYAGAEDIRFFELNKNAKISAADFLALTPEDVRDAPKGPEFKPFDRVLVRDSDDGVYGLHIYIRIAKNTSRLVIGQ